VGQHIDAYDPVVTGLCERGLVTVIGNAGFWARHMYLVGGLAARYLTTPSETPSTAHVGSRDVDLAVVIARDAADADYETLAKNLRDGGFVQAPKADDPAFRWRHTTGGHDIVVEFLGESDDVEPGRIFKPRAGSGSVFQVANIPGVRLLPSDHDVIEVTAERLGIGGWSTVKVKLAGLLPYVVLKERAYRDRHHAKDVYDLVYALRHQPDGAPGSGKRMAQSAVAQDPLVLEAIDELAERFGEASNDGPTDYAAFMEVTGNPEEAARFRNEAVAVVTTAIGAFRQG